MSIASHSLLTNSNSRFSFYFKNANLKSPIFSLPLPYSHSVNPPHFQMPRIQLPNAYNFRSFRSHRGPIRAFESDSTLRKQDGIDNFNLDAFLSIAEFLCLASSAVITIGFAVKSAFASSQKPILVWLGSRVSVWQFVLLVGGVVISAAIRRRQWRKICTNFSKLGDGSGGNLVERIEKLEEGLRSTATIIRVLSRQLEKLGIRFRVTRKALKEPIAETSALAQKNSEATRALAMQEDILEKELGEIQKVLLAMQEQQQKQLELILAIGKTGKLWEGRRAPSRDQGKIESSNSAVDGGVKQMSANEIQALAGEMEGNDRV